MTILLTINATTTMININDAKTHLSRYAQQVKKGARFILCDRNRPFAEIRPLRLTPQGRRPFGKGAGKITVPPDFNASDPRIEALFAGDMS